MECPRCHAGLIADDATWKCPEGHGRFVPAEAIAAQAHVQRRLEKATTSFPSSGCPACGQIMELRHARRIDVDVCPCGGVWLDAGEEKLLRESGGLGAWSVAELLAWMGAALAGFG